MPADALTTGPIVVFVGAGASILPPSSLPGWIDFNTTLLECLGEQVATYTRGRQPVDRLLAALKERRDTTAFLPPDFQAQLMEEEVGADYFHVWQSLDTDVFGPVHAGIAELAAQGRVAAIVTTNFDRLIELALAARGIPCSVHHDQAGFDRLGDDLVTDGLPIIKIHGSIEDAESLVDTLRQRLAGRPTSLEAALRTLLVRHHWLFLGVSGADFSYDPHYLGIHAAADEARGFTFLVRDGVPVQAGVTALVERYGDKAALTVGNLQTWLTDTFSLPPLTVPDASARTSEGAHAEVRARITEWTARLGPLAVVNILCAMLRTMQMDEQAHWLLRRTWRSYRTPDDQRAAPSYDRYNHNYGLSLMEHGFIGNRIALADDMSNLREWRDAADGDAAQFFRRAWQRDELHVAGAHFATCKAYLGAVGEAVRIASVVTDAVIARGRTLEYVDVALACVPLYDIVQAIELTIPQLAGCVRIARDLGDEPRRALALVHLARFLCMTGRFDESREALGEGIRIAQRLALRDVQRLGRSVHGRLLLDDAQSDEEALAVLQDVVDELHDRATTPLFTHVDLADPALAPTIIAGTPPPLCRALLDLNRAARFAGRGDVMHTTLHEALDLTQHRFPGYLVHTVAANVQCMLHHGDASSLDAIDECIADVRELAVTSGNPWATTIADQLAEGRAALAAGVHDATDPTVTD